MMQSGRRHDEHERIERARKKNDAIRSKKSNQYFSQMTTKEIKENLSLSL